MTKLDDALATKTPATTKAVGASRLDAALAGTRPYKPIKVPVHGVEHDAVMTVLGSARHLDIEGETAKAMERRGLEQNVLNQAKFELDEATRVLAEVVLNSEADPRPFGTLQGWGKLVPEVISDLWLQYAELRAAHDPQLAELSKLEFDGIADAVSKKNGPSLVFFGARRLARFLLTSADQPASSSTSRSQPGASSSDNSPSDSPNTAETDDDSAT